MNARSREETRRVRLVGKRPAVAVLGCLLAALLAGGAFAAIVSTTGAVVQISPPPSLVQNTFESDTEIRAFDEKQDFTTPVPISVDFTAAGTYDQFTDLQPSVIPAGTCVDSHILHFDTVGANLVTLAGSATLDADVIGVILTDARLNASDANLGVSPPFPLYPTGAAARGYELSPLGPDDVSLSADLRTVSVEATVGGAMEEVRVVTACDGAPATLTLDPKAATNPVDSEHCVTATVLDSAGNPVQDIVVRFSVTGSVNTSGSATTDNSGEATFCYTGPALPGADAIHAFADTDEDGVQDAPPPLGDEPFDDATKTWVLPVTTPGCEIKITNGGWIIASNGDRASFGGNAKADEDGNVTGEEEYQDHGPAQPFNLHGNVLVVVCNSATSATIFGQATIDGSGSHTYRIDVQDLREPGKGFDHYRMRVNAYDSGDQTLRGGNVQIHKS